MITSLSVRLPMLLVIPMFLASACARDAVEATRTVSYYQENADERKQMIGRCADDPGTLGRTPNCINAKQAEMREAPSLRELPPLGLSEPKDESSKRKDSGSANEER